LLVNRTFMKILWTLSFTRLFSGSSSWMFWYVCDFPLRTLLLCSNMRKKIGIDFGIPWGSFTYYVTFGIIFVQTSFLCKVIFFPPNFSFVFWKREIWREKIYLAKMVFPFWNSLKICRKFQWNSVVP
jgi:hypothetical protein